MDPKLEDISERLQLIENRNKKVEQDKTWETSRTRKFSISIFTYLSISLYFFGIGIEKPFVNAVVPTLGFLLSTLSLPWIRKVWEKQNSYKH